MNPLASPFRLDPADIMPRAENVVLGWGRKWGQIIYQLKAHGLPQESSEWGRQDAFALNFILEGSGRYRSADGRCWDLAPGTLYHRFPRLRASIEMDTSIPFTEFFIIPDRLTTSALQQLGLIPRRPVLEVGLDPSILEGFRRLRDCCRLPAEQVSRRHRILALIEFMTGLYERAQQKPGAGYWEERMHRAALALERDLGERVRMDEVAAEIGVSPSALRREFKRIHQVSPGEFRIRRRLDRACDFLLHRSVKETAVLLGYPDPFTFSTQFRRFLGFSPRQFQQNNRLRSSRLLQTPSRSGSGARVSRAVLRPRRSQPGEPESTGLGRERAPVTDSPMDQPRRGMAGAAAGSAGLPR